VWTRDVGRYGYKVGRPSDRVRLPADRPTPTGHARPRSTCFSIATCSTRLDASTGWPWRRLRPGRRSLLGDRAGAGRTGSSSIALDGTPPTTRHIPVRLQSQRPPGRRHRLRTRGDRPRWGPSTASGRDDPCVAARPAVFLCDTAHNGGTAEGSDSTFALRATSPCGRRLTATATTTPVVVRDAFSSGRHRPYCGRRRGHDPFGQRGDVPFRWTPTATAGDPVSDRDGPSLAIRPTTAARPIRSLRSLSGGMPLFCNFNASEKDPRMKRRPWQSGWVLLEGPGAPAGDPCATFRQSRPYRRAERPGPRLRGRTATCLSSTRTTAEARRFGSHCDAACRLQPSCWNPRRSGGAGRPGFTFLSADGHTLDSTSR